MRLLNITGLQRRNGLCQGDDLPRFSFSPHRNPMRESYAHFTEKLCLREVSLPVVVTEQRRREAETGHEVDTELQRLGEGSPSPGSSHGVNLRGRACPLCCLGSRAAACHGITTWTHSRLHALTVGQENYLHHAGASHSGLGPIKT